MADTPKDGSRPAIDLNIPRDRHLFGPGPKRILALDGGGVRGVIAIAFLERIEEVLKEQAGKPVLLSDYFDLIGGTSTGSIIGAALALGMPVKKVKKFYFDLAPNVFKRSWLRVPYVRARFDAEALSRELDDIIGDRLLDSTDLQTGYCVVAKRMDTGSVWTMTNNPLAPYWETPADNQFLGNRHYRLANLIRASTAAPTYFDPERLPIGDSEHDGLFVDGGVSPYNNPVISLLLQSQLAAFKLRWKPGPENLKIVSIGTGTHRKRMKVPSRAVTMLRKFRTLVDFTSTLNIAVESLKSVIDDSEVQSLMVMQWLGHTPKEQKWWVNSEVLHMRDEEPQHQPMFSFFRYNLRLEHDFLKEWADTVCSESELNRIREMDDVGMMERSYEIAAKAAKIAVRPQDWAWPVAQAKQTAPV
jgi:hypothetical protein